MRTLTKKKKIVILIVLSILIIGVIIFWYTASPSTPTNSPSLATTSEKRVVLTPTTPSMQPLDEKSLSSYTETKADQIIPAPATIIDKRKTKLFKLQEDTNGFTPSEIIVSRADRIRIQFTALDGSYDLAFAPPIGAYVAAAQGGSTYLGFDAIYMTPGIYTFVCQKLCPPHYAQGTLVIK